jgi:hypothetical protein
MQGDNTDISKELHFNTGIEVVSPEDPPRLYQVQRNRSQASRKVRQYFIQRAEYNLVC